MIKLTRRGVQIVLGTLWILDGLFQLQPRMFSGAFATKVIDPAIKGQPKFVSAPMHLGVHLFLLQPVVFNALFALTQIIIGILILKEKTIREGLILSVAWGLIVWVFGEGYNGIFSGHTSLLMGAPGSVILYVILALAVMPSRGKTDKTRPAYWLAIVWLILWVGGGVYQLLPGQNSDGSLSAMISSNSTGAPSWLASVDNKTASYINTLNKGGNKVITTQTASAMNMGSSESMNMSGNSKVKIIAILAIVQFCIGFGVLFPGRWRKFALGAGVALSIVFWIVGQNLGGYYTGLATDLNSGPIFILLAFAILGCNDLDQKLSVLNRKIEVIMTGKPAST